MKAKDTQITLVGGQTMPVYQLLIEFMPKNVFLVHSKDSKKQAEKIFQLYQEINREAKADYKEINPLNFSENIKIFQEIVRENQDIRLNVTSGTKPMTLALFQAGNLELVNDIIYLNQNGIYENLTNGEKITLKKQLTVREIFALNDNPISSSKKLDSYTADEIDSYLKIIDLLKFNLKEFYSIFKQVNRSPNLTDFTTKFGSTLVYSSKEKSVIISLKKNDRILKKEFRFPNSHSIVMNTGWYELFVAKAISSWGKKIEVLLNVKVPFKSGADKNEIDIIVNTGAKLYFFECKTQVFDTKDIDKFAGVVKNYGGLSSKAFFITNEKMNERHLEKCIDQKIIPVQLNILDSDFISFCKILSEENTNTNIK